MTMPFYTYIVECSDGTLYTGWTNDLEKRVDAHNEGRGGRYTRSRLPVTVVYSEEFASKREAMRREWAIKKMKRSAKQSLKQSRPAEPGVPPGAAEFGGGVYAQPARPAAGKTS
ncbi:MAG: GIY-YIG nuclease family protein [Synergistaceae bacterium]|jgi:putative endonuclease|nr:GIY-YIG nuclease family protein [Synergistaceae bacterium]